MKFRSLPAALLTGLALLAHAFAQDPAPAAPAPDPIMVELKTVVDQITAKIKTGPRTAETIAAELRLFEALVAKYAGQKSEAVANVSLIHAALYLEVLRDPVKGRELLHVVKANFPGTRAAGSVDHVLAQLDRVAEAKGAQSALVGQPAPELNFQWSSRAGLQTLSSLKGQVVVLDFWATWCGPCISSFPQIREHVAHFKGAPVTFLGVTSLQGTVANLGASRIDTKGDPAREMALMTDFMKAKDMTWDVVFSVEEVFNPAYGITGIPYVAIIAPDGTVRHTGLHPGNPASDLAGKIEALLREFKLPLPAKS
jgi:thiol-disulfide isomerase/thioredoxin